MELNIVRDLLGKTKGVDGYVVMDLSGAVLTQNLGTYANHFKRTEFATWILNCFYAVDSYYPQAFCLLLRYASGCLYLTRTDNQLITVMCHRGADVLSIENAFSKYRHAMAKSDTSGVVRDKSKKGETVFLKISETGAGATASPIPQKKSGSPAGLIIGGIVALCAIIGGVAFLMTKPKDAAAPPPFPSVTQKSTNSQPQPPSLSQAIQPAGITESTAAIARDHAAALAKIANQQEATDLAPMDMARALATNQSAIQLFNASSYQEAIDLWNQSAAAYGRAAVTSSEKKLNTAIDEAGLAEIRNYPTPLWISVEGAIKEARSAADQGNYTNAVQMTVEQTKKIPNLKQQLLAQLTGLAVKAANSNNTSAALGFYEKVIALDSNNAVAKAYIYRNRFQPGETLTNSAGITLVYIPPGTFNRGSPENEAYRDSDETQATITMTAGFFMAATEVTQEQWEKVMGQRMRMEDSDADFIGRSLPVHSITWEQANQFCRRLSELEGKTYRLPTEAEWEYAARAGTAGPYNNGKDRLTSQDANIYDPSGEGLDTVAAVASVGQANDWGLYDMHGNVSEWTADWSAAYPEGPQTDPQGPIDSDGRVDLAMKIVRGGSFIDDANLARSANRSEASPVVANSYTGFRPTLVFSDL
ncbi:hypothetical protein GCM10007047_05530 [Cerasicoccus arenae]|uniref:Sulfatase-modifying factor enzyme-like domain-containing protein n=2 Tax=Cerasicoccus arenae TaxID=424488 RepID=A0A8J3GCZ6_9BACT|nr:hypothetical protein GCM10007047_05530 [Cerasicoccus arenae]